MDIGTLYFLLVCLFAVIIEKKLSNGENFEVCVNIYEIEVFGKRLSGYSLVHASFLYMEATKKYYIEAAAIIARLQLCFLLYILHTQDISTITTP